MVHKKFRIFIISLIMLFFANSKVNAINTIIRVGVQPNLPPYQFVDNDVLKGLHIDVMDNIAEKYNYTIEYVIMDTNTESFDALGKGKVDIVLGVKKDNDLYSGVSLTENISQSSICVIANNNKTHNLSSVIDYGHMVSVYESNTISYPYIRNMQNLRSIVVSNQERAFNLLASRKTDMVIGVRDSLIYQMEKAGLENSYTIINNFIVPISYTMAVMDGDEDLLYRIDSAIREMRINGEYEAIYNKWIDESQHIRKEIINNIFRFIMIIIVVALTIIVFNIRMNFLLRKQVNQKTYELQKSNEDLENQIIETRNNSEVKNRIVEDNPNAIVVFDLYYNITLFNPSASKLTGIFPYPIGRKVFEIDLLNSILCDKKKQVFTKDSKFIFKDITVKDKKGRDLTYRYDIYQLLDSNDRIRGAILSIKDITLVRKNWEIMVEREKIKALNLMIPGIAHEIRNPLMAIKTFVELIPIKKDNPKFQEQMVRYVPKELDRIDNLIKSLIDYAKPKNSYKEKVIIMDIINSCILIASTLIDEKREDLIIDIEDDLAIIADSSQLKQILINIILNGYESMDEKASSFDQLERKLRMIIKAWSDEQYVYIEIIDEGMGMDSNEIMKATDPFYTTKAKGTGLGLAIAKQYIQENDGNMTIESEKNKFTKITLRFDKH